MKLINIVKNNTVQFNRYRKGYLFYTVNYDNNTYEFPVEINDTGDADFLNQDKAILFMRYIRQALDGGTFNKIS
jgi:hypothetical protein